MNEELNGVPSPAEIEALIQSVFGSNAMVGFVEVVNRKTDYVVLLVDMLRPSMRVVIKLAGDAAAEAYNFKRSAVIYEIVTQYTDIQMPEIYALDLSCDHWPWRYIVKSYIAGVEWAQLQPELNQAELNDAFRQIGKAVAQLHLIHFPSFGEINLDGTVSGSPSLITALSNRADRFIKDEGLRDFFLEVLNARQPEFEGIEIADLTHEDLHKHNILFVKHKDQWRLATLLDFDKAWAGHGESDLSRMDLWRGMHHKAFWETYRQLVQLSPGYEARRPVYQLLWCLEFGDPGEQHYLDSTQVCAELDVKLPYWFED
jgi:fructosamine-3-kinase